MLQLLSRDRKEKMMYLYIFEDEGIYVSHEEPSEEDLMGIAEGYVRIITWNEVLSNGQLEHLDDVSSIIGGGPS